MANARADQAPARSEISLAAACTLIAILSVELVAAPGRAWAAEATDAESRPQNQPALAPTPMTTNPPAVDAASISPSPSRWARVPTWQRVLGVGAILTGLAAVGSGAFLLWLDGQSSCWPAKCSASNYHTALAGWLLVAGGTAASLGGVTLLLVPPTGESRSHPVAGLALSASF